MDSERDLKFSEKVARKAGKLLKENFDVSRKVHYKGTVDLVTNFDRQSQGLICQELSSRFPGHDFLAEEGINEQRGSEYCWIIDPLDGTTNYAHHFPVFSVSIALEYRKEIILGVVYDPMRDEMFSAFKGGGAFLNGKKVKVSSINVLNQSLLATGFPYDIRETEVNNIDHFSNFALRTQAVRRCGSAALDLCYVGCSRFDGFWELKLHPWDVAAGSLIVQEAGGVVSDFKNGSLNIFGTEVLASNGKIHEEMINVLRMGRS